MSKSTNSETVAKIVAKAPRAESVRIGLAAEILNVSLSELRKLLRKGEIAAVKDEATGRMQVTLAGLYDYNREQTARRADMVIGLMTQDAAAAYLGRSPRTITRWVEEGLLPRDSVGRVSRATVERLGAERDIFQSSVERHKLIPTNEVLSEYGITVARLYELRSIGSVVPTKVHGDRKLYYSRETLDEIFRNNDEKKSA